MPILSIQGVALPVLIDSLEMSLEMVGSKKRNQRGWTVMDRRAMKRSIAFVLAPQLLDEAMMYKALINGEGEFWYGGVAYGGKGYALSGTGAHTSSGGGNPVNTNGVYRTTTGQTLGIPSSSNFYNQTPVAWNQSGLPGVFGTSVVGWRFDEAAGTYRAFGFSWRTRDTVATIKREALGTAGGLGTLGTPQAYTGPETVAVVGGSLVITAASSVRWSNLHVIPWYLKAAQLDALISGRNNLSVTAPDLPKVNVQSDLWPVDNVITPAGTNESDLICFGNVESFAVQPRMNAGAFDKTFTGMSGSLDEV